MNRNSSKRCRVCGDDSFVYFYYDGLSCKSCKKFFARNASRLNEFKCHQQVAASISHSSPSSSSSMDVLCTLDPTYRKCCRRCRLNQCLKIGMRTDLIEKPKRGRRRPGNVVPGLTQQPRPQSQPGQSSKGNQSPLPLLLKCSNSLSLTAVEQTNLDQACANSSIFCPPWPMTPEGVVGLGSGDGEAPYQVVGEVTRLADAFRIGDLVSRRYVAFCRQLAPFRVLSLQDQLTLVKHHFPEMSATYVAYYVHPREQVLPIVTEQNDPRQVYLMRLDRFENRVKAGEENDARLLRHHATYHCFNRAMKRSLKSDPIIRDLVILQLLFQDRPGLRSREYVQYLHHRHRYLLLRYLEHRWQHRRRAASHFHRLMATLATMGGVVAHTRRVHQYVYQYFEAQAITDQEHTAQHLSSLVAAEVYGRPDENEHKNTQKVN